MFYSVRFSHTRLKLLTTDIKRNISANEIWFLLLSFSSRKFIKIIKCQVKLSHTFV